MRVGMTATMTRGVRVQTGPGCRVCFRQDISANAELCGKCRKAFRPTPLDLVLESIGWSDQQFADATGLPLRTVIRACKGERMSKRSARRLSVITGLREEAFR